MREIASTPLAKPFFETFFTKKWIVFFPLRSVKRAMWKFDQHSMGQTATPGTAGTPSGTPPDPQTW